jgi:hypothetical protein
VGHFVVQDFRPGEDRLFFDAAQTGIDDFGKLARLITGIEQSAEGAIFHFGSQASITLVGVALDDLSTDMVMFHLGSP